MHVSIVTRLHLKLLDTSAVQYRMVDFNYNVAGAVTGILGLVLPFLLFIQCRPRPMLRALEEALLVLEKVLSDGRNDGIPDDDFPFHGWEHVQREFEQHKKHTHLLRSDVNRLTSYLSEAKAILRGLTYQLYIRRRKVLSTLATVSAAELRERQRQLLHESCSQSTSLTRVVVAARSSVVEASNANSSESSIEDIDSLSEVSASGPPKSQDEGTAVSLEDGKRTLGRITVDDNLKVQPDNAIRIPRSNWARLARIDGVEYGVDLGYSAEAVKDAATEMAQAALTKWLKSQ
ncbi:uncharacterized protein C8Q71DRAFT_727729 [Rhodofomes roseus]|uniref:Uncharacterized protein n=1 Tax=Rhodofomes roseus TaxID=34475 RepID=A0ABQ8JZZ1_9APHY|nr:uncharacterized protein C8Q71DRAFT_727729 [Rhodofomes roseus]KAH9829955.1 hypothetical protein C8Q71DRAFT_727729 [Rhodofomes roseus]